MHAVRDTRSLRLCGGVLLILMLPVASQGEELGCFLEVDVGVPGAMSIWAAVGAPPDVRVVTRVDLIESSRGASFGMHPQLSSAWTETT